MNFEEAQRIRNAVNVLRGVPDRTPREEAALQSGLSRLAAADQEISDTGSTYKGLAHGLTFGHPEELTGLWEAATGGSFQEGRDRSRENYQAAYAANPSAFDKGDMGGSVLSMLAPGVGVSKVPGAGKAIVGGVLGAILGGDAGIQYAQVKDDPLETMGDYWNAVKTPGAVGAVAGGVSPILGKVLGRSARGVADARIPAVPGYGRNSSRIMGGVMDDVADSGRDIRRYLDTLTPDSMLVDVPELHLPGMALTATPGPGGARLTSRLVSRADDSPQRITRALDQYLETPDAAFNARRANALERTSVFGPEYDVAVSASGRLDGADLLKKLEGMTENAGTDTRLILRRFTKDIADSLDESGTINPEKLHWIRSDLSDLREQLIGPKKKNALVNAALDEMDSVLDNIPGYPEARTGYANTYAMDRAIDDGQSALRGGRSTAKSADELQAYMAGLSEAELDAFKKGVRRDVAALMGTSKNGSAAAWGEFNKQWNEDKLRLLLGADADPIIKRMNSEQAFSQTRGTVTAGSNTTRGQGFKAKIAPYTDPSTGLQPGVVSRVKRNAFDVPVNAAIDSVLYGPRADRVSRELGDMLSSSGPEMNSVIDALLSGKSKRAANFDLEKKIEKLGGLLGMLGTGGAISSVK